MTKDELIAQLQEIEGNPEILLASDEEWNKIFSLYEVSPTHGLKYKTRWGADAWDTIHPDDLEEYSDSDVVDVLVFWG